MTKQKKSGPQKGSRQTMATKRKKKFAKYVVESGKIGESGQRVGWADTAYASKQMKDPIVLKEIERQMEKQGVTDEYLAMKVKEGCEATIPPKLSKEGATLRPEHPDFFVRGQYVDKAFKVKGSYAPQEHVVSEKRVIIVLNLDMADALLASGKISKEEYAELKSKIAGTIESSSEIIESEDLAEVDSD